MDLIGRSVFECTLRKGHLVIVLRKAERQQPLMNHVQDRVQDVDKPEKYQASFCYKDIIGEGMDKPRLYVTAPVR